MYEVSQVCKEGSEIESENENESKSKSLCDSKWVCESEKLECVYQSHVLLEDSNRVNSFESAKQTLLKESESETMIVIDRLFTRVREFIAIPRHVWARRRLGSVQSFYHMGHQVYIFHHKVEGEGRRVHWTWYQPSGV